jgi:signal transduction histidine kinase
MLHDLTKRNIRLSKVYAAPSDLVWADNQKLGQVFLNVMLNAYEAMPSGGQLSIHTSVLPEDGTSGLNRDGGDGNGDLLQISFQDTGPGISPEHLDRLFDPFFTTKEAGTGLGLSIVYGIVMEHHGLIDVVSEPNRGASINLRLPLFKEQEAFA